MKIYELNDNSFLVVFATKKKQNCSSVNAERITKITAS